MIENLTQLLSKLNAIGGRKRYRFARNHEIYKKNKLTKPRKSYSKLAIEYGLAATRIGRIVQDHARILNSLDAKGCEK